MVIICTIISYASLFLLGYKNLKKQNCVLIIFVSCHMVSSQ
jgi:hypothetical protein